MDEHGGTINHWIRFYSSMLERGQIQENGAAHSRLKHFKMLKVTRKTVEAVKLTRYRNLIRLINEEKSAE